MNSSCFIICKLNWIVFMAIVKHFHVKMRLPSFCCANLIKYKYTFCLVSLLFSLNSNGVESHCNVNGVFSFQQNMLSWSSRRERQLDEQDRR